MSLPQIDIWYGSNQTFGRCGNPQRWVNLPGRASSPDGIDSVRWMLNNDETIDHPLPLGPTAFRLLGDGDFNIELDREALMQGDNTVEIIATDRNGNEAGQTVAVRYAPASSCPLPHTVNWGQTKEINDVAQVVDGLWRLTDDGVRTVEIGYDRIIAIGDVEWTDYEATTTMIIHGYDERPVKQCWPSFGAWAGFVLRWQGHHDWHDIYPRRGWHPLGCLAGYGGNPRKDGYRLRLIRNPYSPIGDGDTQDLIAGGVAYRLKARAESRPDTPSLYRMKVWPADQTEPDGWQLEGLGGQGELDRGSLLLVAHNTDVTFGDVTVTAV